MKKKTVLALALASAMVVPTVAHVATKVVYAEEEKTLDELKKEVAEKAKKVDTDLSVQIFTNYESEADFKDFTKEQVLKFKAIVDDLSALLGKKIGTYEAKEKSVYEDFNKLVAKAYDESNFLGQESITKYRTEQEKAINDKQGKAVRDAEEALAKAKTDFDKIPSDKWDEKSAAYDEVVASQEDLTEKQEALLKAQNELATKINEIENYQKLKGVVDAFKHRAKKAVAEFEKANTLEAEKKAYEEAKKAYEKYGTKDKIDEAKATAEKNLADAKAKIEKTLKTNTKLTINDVDQYLKDKHGNLKAEDVALIEGLIAKADLDSYSEAEKTLAEIPKDPKAKADDTKYDEAYKAEKAAKTALDNATKSAKEKVSALGMAIDSKLSQEFLSKYKVQQDALKELKDKLEKNEDEEKAWNAEVKNKQEQLDELKKQLKADPENPAVKGRVEVAEKDLKDAQEKLDAAKKDVEEVKGNIAKFEAKSKELYESFKKYNEAVIKGATKAEMDMIKAKLMRELEAYNTFAKKHGLPTIDISSSEVVEKSWVNVDGVWYYRDKDGKDVYKNAWGKIDGLWYRFDEKGAMLADQWVKVGEEWYWVNANGRLSQNEWVYVNNEWYFANASGRIAQNEWFLVNNEWYFANASGRMAQNEWFEVAGVWYYAKEDGRMACNETLEINGTKYSFDESGALA
ncbi:hypothetical protein [uncultured Parvimonas sp.]|uniref:hypothetical protein n=1 Tax=uncultured Parvimonas sp. TaxID=747372 RepID=UPI00288C0D1A|nr:hypothetical protein [uncultured Parvimonas sp.]